MDFSSLTRRASKLDRMAVERFVRTYTLHAEGGLQVMRCEICLVLLRFCSSWVRVGAYALPSVHVDSPARSLRSRHPSRRKAYPPRTSSISQSETGLKYGRNQGEY